MKHLLPLLTVTASLVACKSTGPFPLAAPPDTATLSSWANTALTVAELGGAVNEKQAQAARQVGVFVTTGDAKSLELAALDYAVAKGKLTKEQAEAVKEAKVVPLNVPESSPPLNPLLPPPPGK